MPPDPATPDTSAERRLDADALFTRTDPERLGFETTADVEEVHELVGQARVMQAIRFGIGVRGRGFNIYALGAEETDKRTVVLHHLEDRAADEPVPPDLCYVNDFDDPHRPRALKVPAGVGRRLSKAVDDFLDDLVAGLKGAFESEEYQARKQAVQEEAEKEQQEALEELQKPAPARSSRSRSFRVCDASGGRQQLLGRVTWGATYRSPGPSAGMRTDSTPESPNSRTSSDPGSRPSNR